MISEKSSVKNSVLIKCLY